MAVSTIYPFASPCGLTSLPTGSAAPPGYIGYEDSGLLTEPVRRRPYTTILLDEFEKAHPAVANLLLQILDEGKLTDSQGHSINFTNTILIMTSNLGANILADPASSDNFGVVNPKATKEVLDTVAQAYPPELLNRLDQQVKKLFLCQYFADIFSRSFSIV